ncbi:MAG: MATE family efflux transporter [Lentisphaeria bacterium]|nr:MATE family efflux transporter [Lentisphaeria bacterium]
MKNKYQIDMCRGPLFGQIVLFSVPLMLSGILQLLFNAADLIVIGRFAPHEALAAVGATSSLTALIVTVFMGLSVGTNVLVANYFGAKDRKSVSRTVHTAVLLAIIGGIALAAAGILLAKPLLLLMGTPENVIAKSCLYMWIYFGGMPFIMLYNFGSAVMRAVGDTRRPLYFLLFAGIVNVALNLFFVLVCGMDVAGVALATVAAQGIAAYLVLKCLMDAKDACRLKPRNLRIDPAILKRMLWIGLPAGIQGMFFSLSNITIQSSVNSFGSLAIAGNTAAVSLEGFVYIGSNAFHQTVVSFAGQNLGGGQYDRIRRSIIYCTLCSAAICLVMGYAFFFDGRRLLSVYNSNPDVVSWGMLRMNILFTTYFLCGIMDVMSGGLRGLGHSVMPAAITLLGVCVLRVVWVFTVFPLNPTMENLMLSYPITWIITAAANGIYLYWICRKLFRSGRKTYEI